MNYDGTGKLAEAIAELCGISPKSQAIIARLNKQAKTALGITKKAKILPVEQKLAIYQWHYDRLNPVKNVKQEGIVNADDNSVYDFKQIHFAVTLGHKRTTIMLEGYLVKALQRKHGLSDNTAIRSWLEQVIKNDRRFDNADSLTKQVMRLIIESFV